MAEEVRTTFLRLFMYELIRHAGLSRAIKGSLNPELLDKRQMEIAIEGSLNPLILDLDDLYQKEKLEKAIEGALHPERFEPDNMEKAIEGALHPEKLIDKKLKRAIEGALHPELLNYAKKQEMQRSKRLPAMPTPIPQNKKSYKIRETPIIPPPPGGINFGKLNILLANPKIENIEVQGEGRNVLISKNGVIQQTQVVLTEKEISDAINNFSIMTNIPIVGGIFKAAYQDLLMTAFTSDYGSGRFVLQKRSRLER